MGTPSGFGAALMASSPPLCSDARQPPVTSPPFSPAHFAGNALACRRGDRLVFSGLDFSLADGAALILSGPNGSGKSSLLRVMAGLTPPLRGALTWAGVALGEDPAAHRARLHFIGHLDPVKPVLSVAETLAFWARLGGAARGESRAALERFHLGGLADLPCRFLSAGQRRRLSLARLMASPAPLWLLDEPATSLDDASIEDLLSAIAEHRAAGGMVVVATHHALALGAAETLFLDEFFPRRTP